jgi:outer membrane protein OmpA-like peptidoglycan-associated protein
MMRSIQLPIAVGFVFTAITSFGEEPAGTALAPKKHISFVACPVVRDTKTVPVWLAKYDGEWYYLGIQQDISAEFYPPQLKHEVLVEGTITNQPRICGGIVLKPLTISVMRELNEGCNSVLPAEPGYDAPEAPRPAGPKTSPSEPRPRPAARRPAPPFETKEFEILFSFDDDFLPLRSTNVVAGAFDYAAASRATRVEVHGYRATSRLSNGTDLVEWQEIAAARASKIGEMLIGLGLPKSTVVTSFTSEPQPGNGVTDPSNRRVSIRVLP